jgi:hypothetical protein
MKYLMLTCLFVFFTSCVSTKSTLKNIDPTAKRPAFANEMYLLTEYATDNTYGFDPDYPVNIGFIHENQELINLTYYFNALEGPNGEKISFKKVDTCCPFPTKNTTMGAGTIGVYEVFIAGTTKKLTMYFNTFEKGKILCPKGLTIKKNPTSKQY